MLKFILIALLSAGITAGVSILWPKFIATPRPEALQTVNDFVSKTPLGRETENLLGISDKITPTPINFSTAVSSVSSTVVNTVVNTIEKKVTETIVKQEATQLARQLQNLPPDQQMQIKKLICIPEQ